MKTESGDLKSTSLFGQIVGARLFYAIEYPDKIAVLTQNRKMLRILQITSYHCDFGIVSLCLTLLRDVKFYYKFNSTFS